MSSFVPEESQFRKRTTLEEGNGVPKRAALGNLTNIQAQNIQMPPSIQGFRHCGPSTQSCGVAPSQTSTASSSAPPSTLSNDWVHSRAPVVPAAQFGSSVNITTPVRDALQMEIDTLNSFEEEALDRVDPFDTFTTTQAYLMDAQRTKLPLLRYMETFQTDINPQMREILIDWLVEVTQEYRLKLETLHLTVNYIDRFLGVQRVFRNQLQLVGVACMLIAAKYEEIYPPPVDDFVFITDSTYTREEVILMESRILDRLHFELTIVTPNAMMCCFVRNMGVDCTERMRYLANFLMDITHQDYMFVGFLPSVVAASALSVACYTLNGESWV